jgi:hypothetical protein
VRVEGVRRARDGVELEVEAGLLRHGADPGIDPLGTLRAAELVLQVLLPVHALGRHVGVELEDAPVHVEGVDPGLGDGLVQPGLADIAPGADRVGDDV